MFNHIIHEVPLPKLKQINLDGIRKYVTPEGFSYPSVTTILNKADPAKNQALKKWRYNVGHKEADAIRNSSAVKGSKLHTLCEKYLENDEGYKENTALNALEMFISIKPYLNKIDNVHYIETRLYSNTLKLAGTVDIIAEYDGVLSVIDIKNARKKRTEDMIFTYFLQETAYALMYNEFHNTNLIKQIVTIMAVNADEPQVFIKKPGEYVSPLLKIIRKYYGEN